MTVLKLIGLWCDKMTQISDARKGILTEEMKHVAKIENVSQSFTYKTVNKLYYQKVLFIALIIIAIVFTNRYFGENGIQV